MEELKAEIIESENSDKDILPDDFSSDCTQSDSSHGIQELSCDECHGLSDHLKCGQEVLCTPGNDVDAHGLSDTPGPCGDNEVAGTEDKEKAETENDDGWVYVLGNDQLRKRTVVPGKPKTRPVRGQVVTLRCVGWLEDGTEIDSHSSLKIVLGDDDFIQAFDLCVALMDIGEVCAVVSASRFAYGKNGREPDVPADAWITYELELLSVEDQPEFHTLTVNYRVQLSNEKRERGNSLYAQHEYSRAVDVYTKALKIVDDENEPHTESSDELQLMAETRIKCYNNLAAAQLKVEAWDAAIKSCDRVLVLQPNNVKALFRKGKCLAGKGNLDDAIPMLRSALKLEPDNRVVQLELVRFEQRLREQDRSQRAMFQKMMGTDKQPFITPTVPRPKATRRDLRWFWYVGGALLAFLIPLALTAYSHLKL